MYKKVLVPYDKSEPARRALAQALELTAESPETIVTILNVQDWHDYNAETFKIASRMAGVMGDAVDVAAVGDVSEEAAKEATEAVREDVADILNGRENVQIAIVNGSPHDAITAYGNQHEYDCIVMGHRGMGAVRGMIGSVCYSVLHKASMPVVVVK